MATADGPDNAVIVRIEIPEWAVHDEDRLAAALAAVWADCKLTGYSYVLTRAHELAVVSHHERAAFEQMLRVEMMRKQLQVEQSPKQMQKNALGGKP